MFQSLRVALLSLVVVPVGIAALSATADAGTISLVSTSGANKYTGNEGGGEFGVVEFTGLTIATSPARINGVSGLQDTLFQTFCIEGNHAPLDFYPETMNWTLSTSVNNSGTQISSQTAYLYTQFWNGNLSVPGFTYNYTIGANRVASADALQIALWYFEGLFQGDITQTGDAYDLVQAANTAVAAGGAWFGKGIGDVRVLVLTDNQNHNLQDVLVLVSVPLPPAALLGLGLIGGLGAFGVIRRRRRPTIVS